MWFIFVKKNGEKFYANTQYITNFYYDGTSTIISVLGEGQIVLEGDHTGKLMEVIRMSGVAVKQIGG